MLQNYRYLGLPVKANNFNDELDGEFIKQISQFHSISTYIKPINQSKAKSKMMDIDFSFFSPF